MAKVNAKELIQNKIKEKKVVMFSKPSCPFCVKAKKALDTYKGNGLNEGEYEIVELNRLPNGAEIQKELGKMTGASTVPRVFINGKCIGGGNETEAMHRNGGISKLLTT